MLYMLIQGLTVPKDSPRRHNEIEDLSISWSLCLLGESLGTVNPCISMYSIDCLVIHC